MKETVKYSVALRSNPMRPDDAKKAYAVLQTNGTVTLEDLSEHIRSHGSVFTEGTILGVLYDMCHCTREALLEGNNVELGDLGTFKLSISSDGAESMSKFIAANIKSLNVNFEPGKGLLWDVSNDIDFERVTSRKAQAAAKAAQIKGETSADWTETQEDEEDGGSTEEEEVVAP